MEEDSIVSAGVHTSSVCGVRAACEWQHHNPSSNGNHLNLFAEQQELGKRLVPHGFHQLVFFYSEHLLIQHRVWHLVFNLDSSIFSIPKLFADLAYILGLISEFELFYLQYPPPICGF